MAYLLDTSILAPLANAADAQHAAAARAVVELHRRSEALHVTPQVLIEFHNLATRPKAQSGLGLSNRGRGGAGSGFRGVVPAAGGYAGHFSRLEGPRRRARDRQQAGP